MTTAIPEHYFLYADDDPDDQFLFKDIIRKLSPQYDVVICHQGLELMQFLEALKPGEYLPCCVVLDINMPIWDGVRTLREIRAHRMFKKLPVVMFTTSRSPRDISVCTELGADGFLTKPITQMDIEVTTKAFINYCSTTLQR